MPTISKAKSPQVLSHAVTNCAARFMTANQAINANTMYQGWRHTMVFSSVENVIDRVWFAISTNFGWYELIRRFHHTSPMKGPLFRRPQLGPPVRLGAFATPFAARDFEVASRPSTHTPRNPLKIQQGQI